MFNILSSSLLLLALISAIVVGVLSNIVASLLEKVVGENPRIRKLGPKKQLCFITILFLIFSIPSIYLELTNRNNTELGQKATSAIKTSVAVVEIKNHATENVFEELAISVNDMDCIRASFTVGSPGFQNFRTIDSGVGHSMIYLGKIPYEIRLRSLFGFPMCNTAEFQIAKLEDVTPVPNEISTSSVVITVNRGESEVVFDGDLVISVIDVIIGSDGTKVSAVVGSPGYPNLSFEEQKVGYAVNYEGRELYSIRITRITNSSANFLLKKIGDDSMISVTPFPNSAP